jgi:nucleoside-diphosphate-sugar epimerase
LLRADSPRHTLDGLPLEIATGDVTDRASLDAACRGAGAVIHDAAD